MNNAEPFETIINEPLDENHVYQVDIVAGTNKDQYSGIDRSWAYMRRRILRAGEEQWADTNYVSSTNGTLDGIRDNLLKTAQKARQRIAAIRNEGVSSYLERHSDHKSHLLNGELAPMVQTSQMFTREELLTVLEEAETNAE